MRLGSPGLGPELNDVRVGHLGVGLPEVDVHLPVAGVEVAVVKLELEGTSVPDVLVTLGGAGGEPLADQLNSLIDVSALISDIVGGGPVVAALSPPLALNGETLGKRVDEGVDNTLGEAGEEVQG